MAWEISHSPEAWDNARANLENWTREALIEALCDEKFEVVEPKGGSENAQRAADALRKRLEHPYVGHDMLVDECIRAIERHMTCDNGGFNFYIDPQGYHEVSVSDTEGAHDD